MSEENELTGQEQETEKPKNKGGRPRKNRDDEPTKEVTAEQVVLFLEQEKTGAKKIKLMRTFLAETSEATVKDLIKFLRDTPEIPEGTLKKACQFVFGRPIIPDVVRDDEVNETIEALGDEITQLKRDKANLQNELARVKRRLEHVEAFTDSLKAQAEQQRQMLKGLGENPEPLVTLHNYDKQLATA